MNIWLITGAFNGCGKVLPQQVLAPGEKVVATARKAGDPEQLGRDYLETAVTAAFDMTQAGAEAPAVGVAEA